MTGYLASDVLFCVNVLWYSAKVNLGSAQDLIDLIEVEETTDQILNLTAFFRQLSLADIEIAAQVLLNLADALKASGNLGFERDIAPLVSGLLHLSNFLEKN